MHDLKVTCTLFIIPTGFRNNYHKTYKFIDCLRTAVNFGAEVAQHGWEHSGNEFVSEFGSLAPFPFPSYKKQKERIEAGMKEIVSSTRVMPRGFRAPFYLHNAVTLRALSDLNFRYDSSKTIFKPAYYSRIRLKMMRKVRPSKIKDILEIPVAGDYTYKLGSLDLSYSLQHAFRDFELVRSQNGVFVLNNHPNHVNPNVLLTFLKMFVRKVACKTDFMTLNDVAYLYR